MKLGFIKRYFSIIFIIATIVASFHHHNDLKVHPECKICTINSSMIDADTPIKVTYLQELEITTELIVTKLSNLCSKFTQNNISLRAPPYIF
ncbi:MAG: hypothetical protein GXO30_01090 [Epsilonproteobacteria bacterium]|nr:hypothetical protein [Campylobacterota bacterium]